MEYAVMMTWKHKSPIDWKEIDSSDLSMQPKGSTVQWFDIDEYSHASFVTYTSKECYNGYKGELDTLRNNTSSSMEI